MKRLLCFFLFLFTLTPSLFSCAEATAPSYSAHPVFAQLSEQVQVELLASAIALVTTNEDGYAVRLAVGGVLLNRLKSQAFGDSIYEVITPFLDDFPSSLPITDDKLALSAASDALLGLSPLQTAVYFGRGEVTDGVRNVVWLGEVWFGE